jgi:site-specific recombinase XerD
MKFPNGYGTVYKLTGARRNPWIARVTTGWKIVFNKKTGQEQSRQIYQTIGYFDEKQHALDALVLHRINPVPPKAGITLNELYEEWSKSKYEYIAKSTVRSYKSGWEHLSKYGNVKFKELRTSHIQSLIDSGYRSNLSRSSLEKIKTVASMLYDYALQNDIVNKNYSDFVKLPKIDKEEKSAFTDLEIQKLERAEGTPWVDTILMLIYTGMRINELLGLTIFGVDLDRQVITGGLKTEAGKNRAIPIHPKILKYIEYWYNQNGQYLICNDKGKRISDKVYREKLYYPALEALGIRKLNPHCCRHTFANLMDRAGVDTISIQKLIGHKKYATTADMYTHPDIEKLKKAINMI